MSKVKMIATIVAIMALLVLSALGAAKVELNKILDLAIGAGGLLGAVIAIFKKK